jgi:hypothetical protein
MLRQHRAKIRQEVAGNAKADVLTVGRQCGGRRRTIAASMAEIRVAQP